MIIAPGTTSKIIPMRILDVTSVTSAGKTGLPFNSTNLVCKYKRELAASAVIVSLVTAAVGTWTSGGFIEDTSGVPGQYEIGLPNAAISASDASTWVRIDVYDSGTGLGIAPQSFRIDLQSAASVNVASFSAGAITANAFATGAITAASLASDAVTSIAAGVWVSGTRTLTSFGTLVADIWAGVTQAFYAKFLTQDTGKTWLDAVTGSVAKLIADNASTSPTDIASAVWDSLVANFSAISGSFGAGFAYILAQVAKIGAVTFPMNTPSALLPTPPIVAGRTYNHTYGNQINFIIENLLIPLTTSGLTVEWRFNLGGTTHTFTGVVTSATAGYFEIAQTDTADWGPSQAYPVEVVVVLAGVDINIQNGRKQVIARVGSPPA